MNGRLRAVALLAVLAGAVGSVALMLQAGRNTPRFLLVLFVGWILSPFVLLGWADRLSRRWSPLTRTVLHWVMLLVPLGSLVLYGYFVRNPPRSKPASPFVATPPASWLLIVLVLGVAALLSARRARGTG